MKSKIQRSSVPSLRLLRGWGQILILLMMLTNSLCEVKPANGFPSDDNTVRRLSVGLADPEGQTQDAAERQERGAKDNHKKDGDMLYLDYYEYDDLDDDDDDQKFTVPNPQLDEGKANSRDQSSHDKDALSTDIAPTEYLEHLEKLAENVGKHDRKKVDDMLYLDYYYDDNSQSDGLEPQLDVVAVNASKIKKDELVEGVTEGHDPQIDDKAVPISSQNKDDEKESEDTEHIKSILKENIRNFWRSLGKIGRRRELYGIWPNQKNQGQMSVSLDDHVLSYRSPGYGTIYGTDFATGVGRYDKQTLTSGRQLNTPDFKAVGLGVAPGFAWPIHSAAALKGLLARVIMLRATELKVKYAVAYVDTWLTDPCRNSVAECPRGTECHLGVCYCNPEASGDEQHPQCAEPRHRRTLATDGVLNNYCVKNMDCTSYDINMVCGEERKCKCRVETRWNSRVNQCQLYVATDCRPWGYGKPPTPTIRQSAKSLLDRTLTVHGGQKVNASNSLKELLATSLIYNIKSDNISQQLYEEAFCRDVDAFSFEISERLERTSQYGQNSDNVTGGPGGLSTQALMFLGVIAFATAILMCVRPYISLVKFCTEAAKERTPVELQTDPNYGQMTGDQQLVLHGGMAPLPPSPSAGGLLLPRGQGRGEPAVGGMMMSPIEEEMDVPPPSYESIYGPAAATALETSNETSFNREAQLPPGADAGKPNLNPPAAVDPDSKDDGVQGSSTKVMATEEAAQQPDGLAIEVNLTDNPLSAVSE